MSRSRLFAVVLSLVVVGACYAPNTPALKAKWRGECRVAPGMPLCALESDDGVDNIFWEDHFQRTVLSYGEEQCILDMECHTEPGSTEHFFNELSRCRAENLPQTLPPPPAGSQDRDCLLACHEELRACGGEECDHAEAYACLGEFHACRDAC